MKFFAPLLVAGAALAAAVPVASPSDLVQRETTTIQNFMHELLAQTKVFTGAINKTLATLPEDATEAQKKAAAVPVIKQINGLTALFHEANEKIAHAPSQVDTKTKRAAQTTLGDLPADVLTQLNGKPINLARLLLPVIAELNPAVQSVLNTLYLSEVSAALQPLLKTELPGLITALSNLVNGLLVVLSPLLSALGGLVGGLLLGLGL